MAIEPVKRSRMRFVQTQTASASAETQQPFVNPKWKQRVKLFYLSNNSNVVCRILPALDYDDRTRFSRGRDGECYTDFLYSVTTVSYVGDESAKVAYIPRVLGSDDAGHPYAILRAKAKQLAMASRHSTVAEWNPAWNVHFTAKGQRAGYGNPFRDVSSRVFCNALIYSSGREQYLTRDPKAPMPLGAAPGDPMVLMVFNAIFAERLRALYDIQREDGRYVVDDPVGLYRDSYTVKGVPVDKPIIQGGWFTHIMPAEGASPRTMDRFKHEGVPLHTYEPGAEFNVAGMTRILVPDRNAMRTASAAALAQHRPDVHGPALAVVKQNAKYWFDDPKDPDFPGVLYVPSDEEQAFILAKAFDFAPQLVDLAFREESFYTDMVRGAVANRTTFIGGGAPMTAGDPTADFADMPADLDDIPVDDLEPAPTATGGRSDIGDFDALADGDFEPTGTGIEPESVLDLSGPDESEAPEIAEPAPKAATASGAPDPADAALKLMGKLKK